MAQETMQFRQIFSGKEAFLPLLRLGDEQDSMIARYLDRGDLFALYDDGLQCVCVVTQEGDGVFEVKNLATAPASQGKGYGTRMLQWISQRYAAFGHTLLVGTGQVPRTLAFYQKQGFVLSHWVPDFFLQYDHPIWEQGVLLRDMIYLKKQLHPSPSVLQGR